jgi:hypothetical protein
VEHGYGPHQPHTLELIKDVCSAAAEELGTPDCFDSVLASLYVDPWPAALRSDEPSPWTDVIGVRPEPGQSDFVTSLAQNLVLEHCFAVVSHAGSGTVLSALAAHLPHVCLPLGADQFTNAEQVARSGAGIAIPTDGRDTDSIRRAVEEVLSNDSYASRAAALRAEIDTMAPATDVLATVERRAADRISKG